MCHIGMGSLVNKPKPALCFLLPKISYNIRQSRQSSVALSSEVGSVQGVSIEEVQKTCLSYVIDLALNRKQKLSATGINTTLMFRCTGSA